MAKAAQKLVLSGSRDIPFDKLVLSQSNVRRVKAGVSIGELAEDIVRRTLLQSLNVRPILDSEGQETGRFEVPAGGRRFRALELLVKQKRLARNAPIPCVVRAAHDGVLAEEDSYAENIFREPLHPLDQFTGMQAMIDRGQDVESIAAHFHVTPAVVNQRLRLAKVSPKLREAYADDGMTLEQLMAFSVSDDHERQEQLWELLAHSFNRSGAYIRQKLTENSVRAADKRVRFVTIDAYVAAGGGLVRDLFEPDDGGWLTDPALLDRLVDERLAGEGTRIGAEGWKWVATAIDLPWHATGGMRRLAGTETAMTAEEQATLATLEAEANTLSEQWAEESDVPDEVHQRLEAIEAAIGALTDRPLVFDADEIGIAGAFVSIDIDGTVRVERGFVRPEDEPAEEMGAGEAGVAVAPVTGEEVGTGAVDADADRAPPPAPGDEGEDEETGLKPLPERIVSDLTAWRTLALQNAFAQNPSIAFYAGPDTALAYIGARDDARARSVVWPDRKIHTSIYGDVSRLRLLLEAAGYTEGGLNGARIRRIMDGGSFVVPYIDAGGDLADDGQYLIIGHGNIPSENTNGLGDQSWYCPRCDHATNSHDTVYYSDGSSEEWCYGCYTDRTIFCAYNECSYSDAETFVTVLADDDEHDVLEEDVEAFGAVYLEDRGEWWVSSCCRQCDASGEWVHAADLTEYHGEWLCDEHLPEPFDDDETALANAHVLTFRQVQNDLAAIEIEVARWQAAGKRARDERLRREQEEAERLRLEALRHEPREPRRCPCAHGDRPETPPLADGLVPAIAASPASAATPLHTGV